eukprot:scaffold443_cov177-Amphora_coffeaeformis.AAC.6
MSRRVVALNNTGLRSLEHGSISEAILSFRMAIQCLTNHKTDDHQLNLEGPHDRELLWVKSTPLECVSASTIVESSPHNSFEVYQSAFSFPTTKSLSAYQSEISVILFYNLALAHHLAGLSGVFHHESEGRDAHLRQALKFYKLAMTVVKSNPAQNIDGSCYAMVLGSIVNMGHIFTHFWNTQEANACSRHLHNLLHSSPAVAAISEEDGDFFFTVLAYSTETKAISAPAA